MNLELCSQYYLKALDYYPHNLESTIVNLQYALSYNPDHPQALCMLGQIHMFYLKDYALAKSCFQQSLAADINYPDHIKYLGVLYVWLGEYKSAEKLVDFAWKLPGHSKESLLRIKAMMYEYQRDFDRAKIILERAQLISQSKECITNMKADLSRIKDKQKQLKKSRKQKKQDKILV